MDLVEGRNEGLELNLKLYHGSELRWGYQHSMAEAPTGVLDVFGLYNFTVNEAEPLEKDVAIDRKCSARSLRISSRKTAARVSAHATNRVHASPTRRYSGANRL